MGRGECGKVLNKINHDGLIEVAQVEINKDGEANRNRHGCVHTQLNLRQKNEAWF